MNYLISQTKFKRHTLYLLLLVFAILWAESSFSQSKEFSGNVKDDNGNPMESVSVTIKNKTGMGTLTNLEGNFVIRASDNDVLIFEFVGYRPEELKLEGNAPLNITMSRLEQNLDEVVVIGFGTRAKGELTGSVSQIDSKAFSDRPLTNSVEALQGTLPGVTLTRGSGRPGGQNFSLQIRGASSISGNKVLVLIDGIPGDLNLINPNDIDKITVLKDAAAAIYGARAADGVILVTTKTGSSGKSQVTYSGNYGIKQPQFLKTRAGTLHYAEMFDEGMKNTNRPGVSDEVFEKIRANAAPDPGGWLLFLENFPGFYGSHDWNNDVYGNGSLQNHNLSITGGGENSSYLFSAGFNKDKSILKYGDDHSNRYNLRFNYDFKAFGKLKIKTRTSFERQKTKEPTATDNTHTSENVFYFVNQMGSYVPIYNPLGQFYKFQGGFRNPVQYLEEGGNSTFEDNSVNFNLIGELPLFSGLKVVGQAGINYLFADGKREYPTFTQWNWDGTVFNQVNVPDSALFTNSKVFYQNYSAYLQYNNTFWEKNSLEIMAGSSKESNLNKGTSITGFNFASNNIFSLNLADRTKAEFARFTGNESQWALQSFFGRVGYDFDKRFLLDFTLRLDGSSKFAKDKRWSALFPSVAGAWNLTNEEFIKSSDFIDNMKLRLSWGRAGNQELSFGNYDYITLINIRNVYPLGSPNVEVPGAVSTISSENRTWETITTKNIGIDFGFLNSRLFGSLDYYIKNNNDMLVNEELPATLGGTAPTQNLGRLRTKGWDFSIGWSDQLGKLRYSVRGMISDNKNKLIEIKGNQAFGEGLIHTREGYPMDSYFGYKFQGIIQDERQLEDYKKLGNLPANLNIGDVMFADVDGDGKITAFGDPNLDSKGDLIYLGNLNPRYLYSLNVGLSYEGFSLDVFLQGVGKRSGVKEGELSSPLRWVWMEPLEYFYGKSWTPDNPDAKYPRLIPGSAGFDDIHDWNWRYSAMRLDNMAYLKIKLITFSYTLPNDLTKKVGIQNARVYFSGQDLFTFSKGTWGKSFSPEEVWERSDEQTYPFNNVISFGIDLTF